MKRLLNDKLISLLLISALALAAGCSKKNEPTDHSGGKVDVASTPASAKKSCTEHGLLEDECGICHPERAASLKPGERVKVRLPAVDSAALVGVETAVVTLGTINERIECYAELAFNQNKLAQIAAPVGGIIQEVPVDLGSKVEDPRP